MITIKDLEKLQTERPAALGRESLIAIFNERGEPAWVVSAAYIADLNSRLSRAEVQMMERDFRITTLERRIIELEGALS